ncbi:unnamed protein product [Didymodactylos carnosus]|uniref:Uncharacterized protein n=1 Tax=Didymodactylos carnosus TaxID=1234261 RepID=A0A814JN75_9BILA|nr:unnamed protein product [Didymodactylos carnosus]CAF1037858.1 unnamed protein product [Didymodactylos carnosus]CAF3676230.1 unnamed protein product [Didymodactylos carnosus]CAF3808331.1 unnamed protein product [Didymodactylos carnosus]
MMHQQVQYKGRTKNISITVIDNQEFVFLQDVHDIFPKITVLLNDDNPVKYEMDDKGNRILPLRIKAYLYDILTGYSPDDSDTSANDQGTTTPTLSMEMVTKTKETLLSLLKKLLFFLIISGFQLKSKFFSSTAAASPAGEEASGLLDAFEISSDVVEKEHNITDNDIEELKKMNVEFRDVEKCLCVQQSLSATEMKLFCNVLEKGYGDVKHLTFQNSIGEDTETIKIFSENLKGSTVIFTVTFDAQLRDDEIESVVDILRENEKLEGVFMYGGISDRTAELMANALINKKIVGLLLDAGKVSYNDDEDTQKYKLGLIQNKISDRGAKALAGVLQANEKLSQLSLALNEITSDGIKYIAQALTLHEGLTSLDLSHNKISDDGAIAIAEALKINKSVEYLSLKGNQIGDRGAKAIVEMLSQNTMLKFFHLENNKITNASAKHIEKGLCENKTLSMFWISDNEISNSVFNEMHEKVSQVNKDLSW